MAMTDPCCLQLRHLEIRDFAGQAWDFRIQGVGLDEACPRLEHLSLDCLLFIDAPIVLPRTLVSADIGTSVISAVEQYFAQPEIRSLLPNFRHLVLEDRYEDMYDGKLAELSKLCASLNVDLR